MIRRLSLLLFSLFIMLMHQGRSQNQLSTPDIAAVTTFHLSFLTLVYPAQTHTRTLPVYLWPHVCIHSIPDICTIFCSIHSRHSHHVYYISGIPAQRKRASELTGSHINLNTCKMRSKRSKYKYIPMMEHGNVRCSMCCIPRIPCAMCRRPMPHDVATCFLPKINERGFSV